MSTHVQKFGSSPFVNPLNQNPLNQEPQTPASNRLPIQIAITGAEFALHRDLERRCTAVLKDVGVTIQTYNDESGLFESTLPVAAVLLATRGAVDVEQLRKFRQHEPDAPVVVIGRDGDVPEAVAAMRAGAFHYVSFPCADEELRAVLMKLAEQIRAQRAPLAKPRRISGGSYGNMIGRSEPMQKLFRMIDKVAQSAQPVLILGESGTGKELVARAIHAQGPHAEAPFIAVDCGSIVPTLMESELFGYVKGAFTGALKNKEGLLSMANGGTVFLDEIGELPLDLQTKLLRAIQEREIRPVGATKPVKIEVRIIAATNRNLEEGVKQGTFRRDLYYRLSVVNLRIPALRDRAEDIRPLAEHFLDRINASTGRECSLSRDFIHALETYEWPGNVRELENCMERAAAMTSGPVLQTADLPTQINNSLSGKNPRRSAPANCGAPALSSEAGTVTKRIRTIGELEREAIIDAISRFNGDKLSAAKALGIGKTTLYRKLKEYAGKL